MKHSKILIIPLLSTFFISACGSNNDPVPDVPAPPVAMAKFNITVTNLTNAQPLSPVAVISHNDSYSAFLIGEAATAGLELLAESGDNSQFIQEAADSSNSNVQASGTGPIGPAASETIEVTIEASEVSELSVMTMLVNTNDAITGRSNIGISQLSVDESMNIRGVAYDAGTERNTELAGTIPGPADGGEGFNSMRDDLTDQVTMHPGVVSLDDGLNNSVLTEQHRFDNSVILINIERTE